MVARRIELRSSSIQEDKELHEDPVMNIKGKLQKPKIGASLLWIILIFSALLTFHSYNAYHEQVEEQEQEQKKGMECLYQFKTEECNPLNLTERCEEIVGCVQNSVKDINEMTILQEIFLRTSKSLSETMQGPVSLIFGALLVGYLREKS